MAKLKNVTEAEIKGVIDATDTSLQDMHDIIHRMQTGYCDQITNPAQLAKNYAVLAQATAEMAKLILVKLAMQEQKAELEVLLKERAALEGAKR